MREMSNVERGYYFINREKILNICSECHRGLSERIRESLQNKESD